MSDNGQYHLPIFRKSDVFDNFLGYFATISTDKSPSKAYFLTVWKASFSYIKVRKLSRFTKLTLCHDLREYTWMDVAVERNTAELKSNKSSHNYMMERERGYC